MMVDKKIVLTDKSFCEGCIEGKMQRKPFMTVDHKQATTKLEFVQGDVCGPIQVYSIGRNKCFVTFVDDYSQ